MKSKFFVTTAAVLLGFAVLLPLSPAEARCPGGHGGHRCEGALPQHTQACINELSRRMSHDRAYMTCVQQFGGTNHPNVGYNQPTYYPQQAPRGNYGGNHNRGCATIIHKRATSEAACF